MDIKNLKGSILEIGTVILDYSKTSYLINHGEIDYLDGNIVLITKIQK